MRVVTALSLGLCMLVCAAVQAEDIKSGPQEGDSVGTYRTTKCNTSGPGKTDKTFCYTWVNGKKPVVMVFAKNNDDNLASLVKKLDAAVEEHKDSKLAVVVHLLGEDREALLEEAKAFETKQIPVTVPVENEAGPENWSINPEADLTVFTYKGKKIKNSHGYVKVSDEDIEKILTSVKEIVD